MGIMPKNAAVIYSNGKVGNVRYYTKGGKTYSRVAASEVNNPKTKKQMLTRCRVANIIAIYRALNAYMAKAWENATKNTSKYNLFYKRAVKCAPIYLTKEEKEAGYQIAAPYCFAEGSLEDIQYALNSNGVVETNLSLGDLEISETTTVGELAEAIVANNIGWKFNDFITFLGLKQLTLNGKKKVAVIGANIQLEKNSTELLADKATEGFASTGGHLAMSAAPAAGCYGWAHTRLEGKYLSSTQYFLDCNEVVVAEFGGDEQFELARESYGSFDEAPFMYADGEEDQPSPSGDHRVNLTIEHGTGGSVSGGGYYAAGAHVTVVASPASGYAFEKWVDESDETVSEDADYSFTMPDEDVNLKACFILESDDVTITVSNGNDARGLVAINDGEFKSNDSISVSAGTSVTIKAQANEGSTFKQWSDGDTNATRTVTASETKTFTAQFQGSF